MADIILHTGRHTVIAGVSGNHMAGISREILFEALAEPPRRSVVVMVNDAHDDRIIQNYSVWCKARKKAFSKQQILLTEALHTEAGADQFFARIDHVWKLRPSPSPIFYRDVSGGFYQTDRWTTLSAELATMYRAPVLTVCNLGAHSLIARPILDVPGDLHFQCEDTQRSVTLKCVESGDTTEWTGKPVSGGLIFNRKEHEHAA